MDEFTQPRCPHCGTVLRDVRGGYECGSCELRFLPNVDSPS